MKEGVNGFLITNIVLPCSGRASVCIQVYFLEFHSDREDAPSFFFPRLRC